MISALLAIRSSYVDMMSLSKRLYLYKFNHPMIWCVWRGRQISFKFEQIRNSSTNNDEVGNGAESIKNGPDLKHFIRKVLPKKSIDPFIMKWDNEPYIEPTSLSGNNSKVYIKTYGCQMNVNDTEIASSILEKYDYRIVNEPKQADVVFLMTCAIRENAENKVWVKLRELDKAKRNGHLKKFGLLGCMAERLKTKVIEEIPNIDIVAGPDSYKHLPKLMAINDMTGQSAVNVLLSLDETYSTVMPKNTSDVYSFVSITRGCNNMCSYCIVPYTRGRERSRNIDSIVDEARYKIESGIKEIILLGQNVNSYRDYGSNAEQTAQPQHSMLADGFKTIYKLKPGGIGFEVLLDRIASIDPNVRVRFTSPHPKDFNDSVIEVIAKHKNIAKGLHLPIQSGSDRVLERMRRGYTKEAYLNLIKRIRDSIPECGLSSDFICGFCGETDDDHQLTLDVVKNVGYQIAYIFAYSMRDKTYAYHHLKDDVEHSIKIDRLTQLNRAYREKLVEINQTLIGQRQLILLEGFSKKSNDHLYGRNEANQKVIVPKCNQTNDVDDIQYGIGDFIEIKIVKSTPVTLIGEPIKKTTIVDFYK